MHWDKLEWQTWAIGLLGVGLLIAAFSRKFRELRTTQVSAALAGLGLMVWALAGLTEFSAGGFTIKRAAQSAAEAKNLADELHRSVADLSKAESLQLRALDARIIQLEKAPKGSKQTQGIGPPRRDYISASKRADAVRRSIVGTTPNDSVTPGPWIGLDDRKWKSVGLGGATQRSMTARSEITDGQTPETGNDNPNVSPCCQSYVPDVTLPPCCASKGKNIPLPPREDAIRKPSD